MAYRRGISDKFAPLFHTSEHEESNPMANKWGWYNTIYALAEGKYLNIDQVTRTKVEEAFAFLTYERDLRMMNNVKIG